MALDVHVVTHTHWDREWYQPLEVFRQRLVALVDELIDDPPAAGESFLLDGQAIILEDYLAVRPDRAEALGALLREGRVEAGPWLVLADELIPGGEALVRNLLAGRRVLRRLGATAPPVLYCPDSFGHPAALPTIAAGFGLPLIVLWRGYGGARAPAGDTVRWIAPGGDEAIVFHLPRDGYEYGSHLPADPIAARDRWTRMRSELASRSTTGVLLVPNGADHHARQHDLPAAIAALEEAGREDHVHRSSLDAFARSLVGRASAQPLQVIRGELRDSYGYTWTLQGTFATRAHEKRENAIAERTLLRDTEPWAALAARRGASQRALVETAWRTLLEAHPHDTLCGCSIDDVAAAMELRIRSARQQAHAIRDRAVADLIGHDPVEARARPESWQPIVVIRNAAARRRSGVAFVDLEQFMAHVPVGPGSAPDTQDEQPGVPRVPALAGLGGVQILSQTVTNSRTESPRHYPDNDRVATTRVAAWVPDAPACGIAPFAIGGATRSRGPEQPVVTGPRQLSNGQIAVAVAEDGTISLEGAEGGRRIASLLTIADEQDAGDSYTPAPRPRPHTIEFRGVRRVHRGPLVGELALRFRILDGSPPSRRVDADLEIGLRVIAGASFLGVYVHGDNRREDHRIRLLIHGDVADAAVFADAAFGPVRREPIVVSPEASRMEAPPATAPLHRYVSSFNPTVGLTLFSDGLAEYEPLGDGGFAVTLLRAIGELSRNNLPERPGHAGWPVPIPAAQCLGPFAANFGVLLHGPRRAETIDAIERTADDVLLPLVGSTIRSALALPAAVTGPELSGRGLALSAIKESEDGTGLVLRCVNLLDEAVRGVWRLPSPVGTAALCRIDETVIQELESDGGVVAFEAGPRQVVTIIVR